MKDEIKEILKYIDQFVYVDQTYNDIKLSKIDVKLILDYITNLQEERDMYKGSFETMSKNYFEEKAKTDKAIEYIEKGNKHFKENYNEPYEYAFLVNANEIIKILKGE